jgi:hypothetical protein
MRPVCHIRSIVETRQLLNRSGENLQSFPSVTSESVIRSNGGAGSLLRFDK